MAHGSCNASSWVVINFLGGNPATRQPAAPGPDSQRGPPTNPSTTGITGAAPDDTHGHPPLVFGDDFSSWRKIVNRGRYRTGTKLILNNLLYGSPVTSCQSCANPRHVNRRILGRGVVSDVAKRLSNGLVADWRCPRVASLSDPVLSDHVRNGDISLDGNKLC